MPSYRETRSLKKEKQRQAAARADSRGKRRQALLRRLARGAAALIVLVIVLVAGWAGLGPVRLSGVTDFVKSVGRRGGGFPLESGGGTVLQAVLAGDSLAILWPTKLEVYNAAAYRSLTEKQTHTEPALRASGNRLVQYDRASGKLALFSRTDLLYEKEMPGTVFCAGLNRRGDLAAACGAEGAACEITAWDTKQNKVFSWRCEKEHPSAVQPSKNGKGIGLCLIGTEQAGAYARFVEFAYDKKNPMTDLRVHDAWLYGAVQRSGCWLAVGDRAVYRLERGAKEPTAYSYEGRALQAFDMDENGYCAVLLEDWDNRALLRVYNRRGGLEIEQSFARRPSALRCHGGNVYLCFDNFVLRWKKLGGFRQCDALPPGAQSIFPAGGSAYIITVRSVERERLQWGAAEKGLF